MYKDQTQLLETLVKRNAITRAVAEEIKDKAQASEKQPEEILLGEKIVDEEKITAAKSALLNIPPANLRGIKIVRKVLELIPREVAENYEMVAFKRDGNELHVGMINPQNFKAIEAVEFLAQKAGLKVRHFIISPSSFREAFRSYQVLGEEVDEALAGLKTGDLYRETVGGKKPVKMDEVVKSAPVSKMVLVIIRHAIDGRASDIHIEPGIRDTRVRYRIDGMLRTSLVLPKYIHAAVVARIKVLANMKLDETRKPQDGRIRLTVENREVDFRVSTLPLFEGEKVVLRILDSSDSIPTLDQLGFHKIHIRMIEEAIRKPHGLSLLTGPTGSGKTTTLYTILTMLNQEGSNIVTLEDPIEYYMSGVNQSQIQPEVGYTFAGGLRAILRQDPNIIMLGEIRDAETTELVIHASLTGHMVLSTLHTNSSMGAIPRLIDLGAEPFLLSSVINLVIAQRLARKICPDCKKEAVIPPALIKRVKDQVVDIPPAYLEGIDVNKMQFYQGQGCSHCGNLGYQGRIAVAEVINIDQNLRQIIVEGANQRAIEEQLKKQDFITLAQDTLVKALQGLTTVDEAIRVSQV